MRYITLGRVGEQRRKWWHNMMFYFDCFTGFVGLAGFIWIGWLLIELLVR